MPGADAEANILQPWEQRVRCGGSLPPPGYNKTKKVGLNMELSDRHKKIIMTLAECNMRVSNTARVLYESHNAIDYQIDKIRQETGLNPKCFYDLAKLVDMCR